MLRGKTIEEIVNRWSTELETHVREFNKFAGEVAVWDRALIENGNNVGHSILWPLRLLTSQDSSHGCMLLFSLPSVSKTTSINLSITSSSNKGISLLLLTRTRGQPMKFWVDKAATFVHWTPGRPILNATKSASAHCLIFASS